MNEDIDEVVTIAVMSNGDESIRTITNEYEQSNTCWPHLVEVFLEQLQGLGYKFFATPEEMVDVLEEYHQDCVCAECNSCDEEEKEPVVGEQKYPYTGVFNRESGITIVRFTSPNTGTCLYTEGHPRNTLGEYSQNWAEEDFEKVSK